MKKYVLALICCFFTTGALAQTSGFQLSLTPDVATQAKTTRINGASLNVWGENPQNALAFGIVNGATGVSSGLSLGFLANYAEDYKGAQIAWVANYSSGKFSGLQFSAFNYATTLNGVQFGLVNFAGHSGKGVQVGIVNIMNETKNWFTNFPNEVAPAMVLINWRY